MKRIRLLLVDNSPLERGLVRSLLEAEADIEIVGEAYNGKQAVRMASECKPDLITLDLAIADAIQAIMCNKAVPILVLSEANNPKNVHEALRLGAMDVISKPDDSPEKVAVFLEKVRLLAGIPMITRRRPGNSIGPPPVPKLTRPGTRKGGKAPGRTFAIAASTGGPQALSHILSRLPATFPCPVLIAQHMSDGFAEGMVSWLNRSSTLPVRLAENGQPVEQGTVYVSPSAEHLTINAARCLRLVTRDPGDLYRPSCDKLLISVAESCGPAAVGIILSGMGSDGAQGMARIRQNGGETLGQDEASSVIYGMNRVALESGGVARVLPLHGIPDRMCRIAGLVPGGQLE